MFFTRMNGDEHPTNKYTIYNIQLYYTYIYIIILYSVIIDLDIFLSGFAGRWPEHRMTEVPAPPSTAIKAQLPGAPSTQQGNPPVSGEAMDTFQSSKNITDVTGFMMNFGEFSDLYRICRNWSGIPASLSSYELCCSLFSYWSCDSVSSSASFLLSLRGRHSQRRNHRTLTNKRTIQ